MKALKKTPKYTFIVDLTDCVSPEDVKFEFIKAKATSGVAITEDDINFILTIGMTIALDTIDSAIAGIKYASYETNDVNKIKKIVKILKKKDPWYKRFWRWITFQKNK